MKSRFYTSNFSHVYIHDPERNIISFKSPQIASRSNEVLGRIPHASLLEPAVTNARFASLHGLSVAPSPSRRRPLRFSNRALVTSLHGAGPQERRASVCGSAAALRSGCNSLCAPLRPPLHFPRSPTADRSLSVIASLSEFDYAFAAR